MSLRVVVTGATGNVGTSVLEALGADDRVGEIIGISRRIPNWTPPKVTWRSADVSRDELSGAFAGAHAVIHLAWLIQPSRDAEQLERVNVEGSRRVFEAAVAAGVEVLVHASSIGVYSPGPKDAPVDESWAREGVDTLFYARHKAACEHMLDDLEGRGTRIVRLRPGLIFKAEAGPEIRRLFAGPLVPTMLLKPGRIPVLPLPDRLVVQAVHSRDVADAYRLAALEPQAEGAYNIAADPVLTPDRIAKVLGARRVSVPEKPLRVAADGAWRAHVQPTPPGWLDMGLAVPIMDTSRARSHLGWTPTVDSESALLEVLTGMRETEGLDTPPLKPHAGGPLRIREFLTGVGRRLT
ncbi:NAD-dependent epimerase/dehydratase family protein [Solirubrobacter sp. CPCC 204708]|uniref:NAD-dependent epimerase/dehydratase family protein n=1 Tax=Solirubrobacter deserti TaxID=2282478 RepID=A0ABT4RHN8_9ACTN|nr:NAD-dependent epimerase/dehydratase family protein [Solirubrobacter deserti]MBE2316519.1 NAD-dependent epimerase/dehydratase family protein [Solirubrobacter deserti]MDA0138052.1 NAD-dependent epimerase/dehydratase family protein [Solirubrobacter deserti]